MDLEVQSYDDDQSDADVEEVTLVGDGTVTCDAQESTVDDVEQPERDNVEEQVAEGLEKEHVVERVWKGDVVEAVEQRNVEQTVAAGERAFVAEDVNGPVLLCAEFEIDLGDGLLCLDGNGIELERGICELLGNDCADACGRGRHSGRGGGT